MPVKGTMRQRIKEHATTLFIVGLIALVVAIISVNVFPEWREQPAWILLIGVGTFLAVLTFFDVYSATHNFFRRLRGQDEEKAEAQWDVTSPQNGQVRRDLIANMRLSWIDEESLHEKVHIALDLQYDPTMLESRKQLWEGQPNRRGSVPLGKRISEIFAESGRALLILGDPGSGKTYTLVQLARELLGGTTAENGEPIPVILNLSSWAADKPPFREWLAKQIYQQYQISKTVTPALLQSGQLCLLLDGLDEVEEDARDACVMEINRFRGDGHVAVVVCSRIKDYEGLATQLKLTTAVIIQPLSEAQIAGYLTDRRLQLYAVYEAVQEDDALKELARTPLFLSIMALAYQGYELADLRPLLEDVGQRQYHLYQTYIRRAFSRSRDSISHYSPHQSLAHLAYLAQQLAQRDRYLFFFENLQPGWLPPAAARKYRSLTRLGIGLVFGLVGGLVLGLVGGLADELVSGLVGGLVLGLVLGLVGGMHFGRDREIELVEQLALRRPKSTDLKISRSSPLIVFLVGGLVFGLVGELVGELVDGLAGGLAGGLVFGLYGLLLTILKPSPSRIRSDPGEGIGRSGRIALVGGLGGGLVSGLVFGLIGGLGAGLGIGLIGGLLMGVSFYGGEAFIRHYLLRWQLQRENLLPFRLQPFMDAMAGRIILQRTGPSYRFIHRTLQEHFAGLTEGEIEALAGEIAGR